MELGAEVEHSLRRNPGNAMITTLQPNVFSRSGRRIMDARAPDMTRPGATVAAFEAVSESGDYLMCAKVASLDEDQQPVPVEAADPEQLYKVWKPWFLRRTPFDGLERDGIEYDYSSDSVRTATPAGGEEEDAETQYVTPSYSLRSETQSGELIHALPSTSGDFLDINIAGRCWAVGEEVEEP